MDINTEVEVMEGLEEFEEELLEDELIGNVIHLVMDDDEEMDAIIIAEFDVNDITYVALLPIAEDDSDEDFDDEDGEEEGEVLLYRFMVDEDGNPGLANIETDEEYEAVAAAFDVEMEVMVEEFDEDEE